MPHIILIICVLFSLALAMAVFVNPLLLQAPQAYFPREEVVEEFSESVALLETISELDVDLKMGKLSQEDYERLSLKYKRRFLDLKKQEA
ncbi:MAG: hypothetical protein COB67_06220 [SAR324 cluster bacterium]|uniref:C-type cytochrome biogenesis protein CcmI n=1 Tax=SAR324 cluster bacterium TaxID=2024889 RepID=A0A2A4T4G9_9DELT|nr:MAG: hypothetical protein COB67_06220 [SAR324 cluster bacterium]